ncbi:MAG: type I-B CRISPR-associated protein Cas5, partial [Chloroflexota bacterium]|nr:type I-B CRISPR-associated protein Cas5 [Chloroflexota bacterium]
LFTYTSVEVVELQQAERAYFEHTLLPYSTNRRTSRGYAITMPRYLDYTLGRRPAFAQYFVAQHRIQSTDFLWFGEKTDERYWIDPDSPQIKDAQLGLMFHSFVENENET